MGEPVARHEARAGLTDRFKMLEALRKVGCKIGRGRFFVGGRLR
jgi:hypothetical protein